MGGAGRSRGWRALPLTEGRLSAVGNALRQAQGKLYRAELAPAAQRELPRQVQERLAAPIQDLAENPRPTGVCKVREEEQTWRIRVGPFRIVYDIYNDRALVVVLKVDRRRERTYRL